MDEQQAIETVENHIEEAKKQAERGPTDTLFKYHRDWAFRICRGMQALADSTGNAEAFDEWKQRLLRVLDLDRLAAEHR